MPRLRNETNGAVVSVSAETAVLLGSGWVPVVEPKSESGKSKN